MKYENFILSLSCHDYSVVEIKMLNKSLRFINIAQIRKESGFFDAKTDRIG